ncbi:hypothetical protein QQS21_010637 [Conoideocrella luteorostrata]|uniref:Cyanobacterial phytochrome B n=1 Tax=Conoideocrella luteorostrata TaxID=1105319 RepID=A0AAJ0CFL2_9HYPO|nr:hypothetical protein QQS21_010637 [Conoideocrella luteorostrata]
MDETPRKGADSSAPSSQQPQESKQDGPISLSSLSLATATQDALPPGETSSGLDDPSSSFGGGQDPFSPWSVGSEMQLGHRSAASDISTDRVFPIRSVVSVDRTPRPSTTDDSVHQSSDNENRGVSVHALPYRGHAVGDNRRFDYGPMSPSPYGGSGMAGRRQRALSGPVSSIQADAVRHGTVGVAPVDLDIAASDSESFLEETESGALRGDDAPAVGHDSISHNSANQSLGDLPHMTTRFTHVETEDGHAIITGRDEALQQCEDEPIHTPGAVQGFGVLMALREDSSGSFSVRYVSENSGRIIGHTPQQLFRMKNFLDVLTEEQQDNLLDHIDFIRDEDADPAVNGPEVLSLSIKPSKSNKSAKFWCAIHIHNAHPDLVICEFELDDDLQYPLRPADELTPDIPHDTLHSNPTLEEIEESTEILSRPLRILRSARKRRGEQGAMQVFDIMSQVQEQLASAPNLDTFLKILVGIIKELTGFHRVMIYQFDASFNGKVVTELVDTSQTVDLYKGLHFPASDIPRQARELYKVNKVRLLYDRDLETARLVCRSKEDLDIPLDMTHAYLRAMSPIHLKYLANMAVRSSMSISINAFNELWGLISCHAYGDHGMRVSFPIRKMCRLVGDTASRNIERLSYASRLQARKLINTAPTDKNPSGYIIASSDDLLKLFDADYGLLSIKGETKILGKMEQSQEALVMLEYLRMRKLTSVLASQDVREDFPDLRYPPGFQLIAGLMYVPLSVGGNDFIVFFRRGQAKEVKWAGNPYHKTIRDGTAGYLEPRKSFKLWKETVVGKCREWIEEQLETAAVLCLVYGKFIEVWRQKEAALESSKLTRLLLANSAHEVRTPLNAIINYLEIALEGSLDQETRENLARSHSASKSLIYVINDLLDLTKTEEGQSLIKDEVFDLSLCINEATDPFHVDAKRKGIDYQVNKHPGLPQFVHGDSRRVRQALSNITANAVAHTHSGSVLVEMFVSEVRDGIAFVDFVVADSGVGMSPGQLDALFQDLEQVTTEESDPEPSSPEGEDQKCKTRTLGLGLAVVARVVRNMDGQLRLKSEEGQGSRFVVQLPFLLPGNTPTSESGQVPENASASSSARAVASASAGLNAPQEGEITLIERGSHMNLAAQAAADRQSRGTGSVNSHRSLESLGSYGSQKSDADRLIDAIQTPLSLNDNQAGYFMSRQNSVGSSHQQPMSRISSGGGGRPTSPVSHKAPSPTLSRAEPGTAEVRDSKTRIKAVKVPDDYAEMPSRIPKGEKSGVLFELPNQEPQSAAPGKKAVTLSQDPALAILVAEDDPINMKILRKRLERVGHEVHHTVNGEDCATVYKEKSPQFDVILMDMQMPIVDGLTSAKLIRSLERSDEHKGHSAIAAPNRRIPIFAVSASLVEEKRQTYIDAGFDGWILKPIDFKRLSTLLTGIHNISTRKGCLYTQGEWESGGWFALGERDGSEGATSSEVTPIAETKEVS